MKYSFSKQAVILWASLFIIILIFGATSNFNFISTVEKFDGDRRGVSKLSNISSLDVEYEENKLLLTAQLAVNFSFINTNEKDWLLEIDKTTSLIHKRLSIQHRRHSLPFVVKELMQPQSVCIISIQEYSSGGEMQYLMGNLTAHKRDFAQHHQRESNMGYINVNAQKYRNDHRHLLPANISSTWLKLPILRDMISNDQKHLQQRLRNNRYDWYMWVDADVLFTNFSCTFQELLSANHHLIVPGDLNTGVFFIRNHPWSAQFLDLWFSKWSAFRSSLGQEDEALSSLLNNDIWDRHIYAAPMDSFKLIVSYPHPTPQPSTWQPGHCILHVAGFWNQKAAILRACLQSERVCVQKLDRLYEEIHNSTSSSPSRS